ncbi:hypothetical protein [Nitrosomonas communis]|uniref:Uncharacterized protein n=1 Tax=Nitrosomonas communis TaxID=44574 RepID=A0A1I4VLX2_9PROT|nr:hypothetical protein [Nitrosomonas communis]SFN02251.1 hypothetical protein SAMN05421863_108611 [Nitrosomonas communis]
MDQYIGKDPSMAGRLDWWCGQFREKPITKIDEFIVDDSLVKLKKRGLTVQPSIATNQRYQQFLFILFSTSQF